MPELPEVETVRRGLNQYLPGLVVVGTKTYDSPKSFPNSLADVQAFLIGASVTAVRRRAKALMIDFDSDYSLVIHLKMTGQLVFIRKEGLAPPLVPEVNSDTAPLSLELGQDPRGSANFAPAPANRPKSGSEGSTLETQMVGVSPSSKDTARFGAGHPSDSLVGELPDRSTRASLEFTDGSQLFFNDQRKFGWMRLMPTVEIAEIDFMKKVGPEPLEDSFTAQVFIERLRRRSGTTIKAAILDQTVLAGVGNIYADESLWGAKIHPATRVRDVSDEKLSLLLNEIKTVLLLSIEKGGSTDRNYVNADGKKGSYIEFARVFRREGLPCRRHPDQLLEKIRVASRGTHVCPVCQPSPND